MKEYQETWICLRDLPWLYSEKGSALQSLANQLDAYWHFKTKSSDSIDVNSSSVAGFSRSRRFLVLIGNIFLLCKRIF